VLRVLAVVLLVFASLACKASRANASPPPSPEAAAPPTVVAFASGSRILHGYLYRPTGDGPFPAVVYNHGSERSPTSMGGQAAFYVPRGFVLFVPHRRGQGLSSEAGDYIGYWTWTHAAVVRELLAQTDDVMAAVDYVRSLPYVDGAHVTVTGCSYGGIVSLFAAERGTGIESVVDFAGGAMSWAKSSELQERMKQAARGAKVPVFFVQAENDFDTTPSVVLFDVMQRAGKAARERVFPPNGSTHEEGHHFCYGGQHPAWGDDVLEFLKQSAK
jgi:dienelactone hydrolase